MLETDFISAVITLGIKLLKTEKSIHILRSLSRIKSISLLVLLSGLHYVHFLCCGFLKNGLTFGLNKVGEHIISNTYTAVTYKFSIIVRSRPNFLIYDLEHVTFLFNLITMYMTGPDAD